MKNTMIELISDDELIDFLVDTAHEASVPSESNFLAAVRDELKARLTKRAVDEGDSAPLQAESTPEVLSIEEADTTPALRN